MFGVVVRHDKLQKRSNDQEYGFAGNKSAIGLAKEGGVQCIGGVRYKMMISNMYI